MGSVDRSTSIPNPFRLGTARPVGGCMRPCSEPTTPTRRGLTIRRWRTSSPGGGGGGAVRSWSISSTRSPAGRSCPCAALRLRRRVVLLACSTMASQPRVARAAAAAQVAHFRRRWLRLAAGGKPAWSTRVHACVHPMMHPPSANALWWWSGQVTNTRAAAR